MQRRSGCAEQNSRRPIWLTMGHFGRFSSFQLQLGCHGVLAPLIPLARIQGQHSVANLVLENRKGQVDFTCAEYSAS